MFSRNRLFTLRTLIAAVALTLGMCITSLAQGGTWTTKTSMPGPRSNFAVCVAGGNLYAFGGYGGAHLDTVVAYDIASDTWSSKAPMPVARTGAAAAAVGGKIYVFGGFANSGTTLTTRVDVYDPATDLWATPVAPMPTLRTSFGVAVIDGIIYAVGGAAAGFGGDLSTVEAYDPVAGTWETKAPMATPRAYV